jgi:hypothetical protein
MSAPAAAGALDADDSLLFTQQPLHSAIIDPSTADASIGQWTRDAPA